MAGFIKNIPKAVTGGYLLGTALLILGVLWNLEYLGKGYYTEKHAFIVRGGPAVLGIVATLFGAGFLTIYSTILLMRTPKREPHMDNNLKRDIDEIQQTLGGEAPDYFDTKAMLNLKDNEIRDFLKALTPEEHQRFFDALRRFRHYSSLIGKAWEERLGSNFLLLILTALIEFVMTKESYVDSFPFIDGKLQAVDECDKDIVQSWLDEWRRRYGSGKKIQRFFDENLREYEQQLLEYVRQCEGWSHCTTMKRFVRQLTEYRNDFVHSLDTKQIWPWDQRLLTVQDGTLRGLANPVRVLSIPFVTRIIWIGVFRKFGYQGNL